MGHNRLLLKQRKKNTMKKIRIHREVDNIYGYEAKNFDSIVTAAKFLNRSIPCVRKALQRGGKCAGWNVVEPISTFDQKTEPAGNRIVVHSNGHVSRTFKKVLTRYMWHLNDKMIPFTLTYKTEDMADDFAVVDLKGAGFGRDEMVYLAGLWTIIKFFAYDEDKNSSDDLHVYCEEWYVCANDFTPYDFIWEGNPVSDIEGDILENIRYELWVDPSRHEHPSIFND